MADLLEEHGAHRSIIVSPSNSIPAALSKEGDQPPHKQAANYYRRVQGDRAGQFKVTMDTPDKPLVVTVGSAGASIKASLAAPAAAATISKPARAG